MSATIKFGGGADPHFSPGSKRQDPGRRGWTAGSSTSGDDDEGSEEVGGEAPQMKWEFRRGKLCCEWCLTTTVLSA